MPFITDPLRVVIARQSANGRYEGRWPGGDRPAGQLLFAVGAASAAGSLDIGSVVSNPLTHGESFTISAPSGVNYGTFDGEILAYIDPETIPVGTGMHGVPATISAASRNITLQYGSSGANQHCRINNNRSSRRSGTRSIFIDWDNPDNPTASDTIVGFGISSTGLGGRLFISYKRFQEGNYLSNSEGGSNQNHKDLYVFGSIGSNDMPQFLSYIDAGSTPWGVYNNDGVVPTSNYKAFYQNTLAQGNSAPGPDSSRLRTYATTRDRWMKRDFFIVMNSAPNVLDGTVKVYADGQLVLWRNSNYAHIRSSANAGGQWADIRIGHMCQGFVSTAQANFDEVYMATTPARVELCTDAVFVPAATRICAIQPHLSWASNSITFRVNEGNLPASGDLYAHVFDNDDNLICIQKVR